VLDLQSSVVERAPAKLSLAASQRIASHKQEDVRIVGEGGGAERVSVGEHDERRLRGTLVLVMS